MTEPTILFTLQDEFNTYEFYQEDATMYCRQATVYRPDSIAGGILKKSSHVWGIPMDQYTPLAAVNVLGHMLLRTWQPVNSLTTH